MILEREPRQSAPRAARAGLTLLELLLVLFVLAILFGISFGFLSSLDLGRRQARGMVQSVLRSAQNSAIASRAPARVRLDAARGALVAQGLRVVGTWHFEDRRVDGAFGLEGQADPELFVDDGYLGGALDFAGRVGTSATIPVDHDPAFDFAEGFALECAVRWEHTGGGRLVSIGDAITLEVGGAGEVRGRFRAARARAGESAAGGQVVVQSEAGALAPTRWTRVRLGYDRRELVLEIDGVPVARTREDAPVARVDGPVCLSDERRPFPGSVDRLVVYAVEAGDEVVLPEGARLVDAPALIQFAPGGGLDRAVHEGPVRVAIEFEDGQRQTIVVGSFGTVDA